MHGRGMVHGDLKGVGLLCSAPLSLPNNSFVKLNILIDETGHARLADFGLLAIISDATGLASSSPSAHGGTVRWMSPELLCPHNFGLKDSRPTKNSEYLALGMVIYEVLSGQMPFRHYGTFAVVVMVGRGEHPERPDGAEGRWFTDVVWGILERCWAPKRDDRPSIEDVLPSLEDASRSWMPLPHPVENPPATNSPTWTLSDSSTRGSAGKREVASLSQAAPLPPLSALPLKGDTGDDSSSPSSDGFPALLYDALDHQGLEEYVKNPKKPNSEESIGWVSVTGLLDRFWY